MADKFVPTISLEYFDGKNLMEPGDIRISASSIARYITDTRKFWGELMLNETGFVGSTASILGTCTHAFGEGYVVDGDVSGEQIEDYIESECARTPEANADIIREQYPIMGPKLINDYIIPNPPTFVEEFLMHPVLTTDTGVVYVGGSCDNCTIPGIEYDPSVTSESLTTDQPGIVTDYKTTSSKTLPDRIPYEYRLQALTYAYLYKQRGITIDRIRIVYVTRNDTGRVGKYNEKTKKYGVVKQYPTQVKVLTESIADHDFEYIEGIISVIARSIELWQNQPELRSIIAQDSRIN